jgi:hypothetical protein
MSITLTNQRVIIATPEIKEKTTKFGLLETVNKKQDKYPTSIILHCAADCEDAEVGMTVMFDPKLKETLEDSELFTKNEMIIRESDILAYGV